MSSTTHPHDEEHTPSAVGYRPPNALQRFKAAYGEYFGEMTGAGLIILFGAGAQLQAQLYSGGPDPLTCGFGWAIGVGIGAYVASSISGGHINPAVTIAMAAFRRFPLSKVPGYILAQIVGCFFGTLIIFTNYTEAISELEGTLGHSIYGDTATAGNFISVPKPGLSAATAFYDEFLGTAMLVGGVFAFTQPTLVGPAVPLAVLFVLLGISVSVGAQTGFAINPARDFGPRIALTILGYPAKTLWSHNQGYWFHSIWCADILGALIGGGIVDLLIYQGPASIFHKTAANGLLNGR